MQVLNVKLERNSYDIFVHPGLLHSTGQLLSEWYNGKNIAVVMDNNVDLLYGESLTAALKLYNYTVSKIVIPPGEQSKSLNTINIIYNKLAEYGITRDSLIVAFGGGVVGDLAGFAAATFMRGVPYVQIPTTVMSQLDSSIGGKTAVNLDAGKNLAGCFYQPKAVYIDTLLLDTLPDRAFADGIAEAVKYAAIKDSDLFQKLQGMESLKHVRRNINDIIYRCVAIKCQVVSADEFDRGERMLLNFGHTIGHGIERYFDYEAYTHGESIALGMIIITKGSEAMGITKTGTAQAIMELLAKFNLPMSLDSIDNSKLLHFINADKKSVGTNINLILLREIGSAFIYKVPKEELINFIG